MIQVLDQNDKLIYQYRLIQGENKFGSDSKLCKFIIRNVQNVLFSIVMINNDVYLTHFSDTFNVYKDSTLKPYSKVEIPKNFLIEMFPTKNYYFQNYKFQLLDFNQQVQQKDSYQFQTTQNLEEFQGTMPLEDIFQIPQQPPIISTTQQFMTTQVLNTQDPCQSTLIIEEPDQAEIFTLNELIVQYSNMKLINQQTSNIKQEVATQTNLLEQEQPPIQKKATLFSDLFKIKKQQQNTTTNVITKIQSPQPQIIDSTVIDSQILGATVNDDEQQKFFEKKDEIKGTVIDEELEKVFSSQFNKEEQNSQISQFKRINSRESEQNNNNHTLPKKEVYQNIELNDIFGSLPELPNQNIVQPVIKRFSSLKSNLLSMKSDEIQEEKKQSQQEDTPIKFKQQGNKESKNNKKKEKQKKEKIKKVGMLKKITDEISNNSNSELEEEKIQFQQESQVSQSLNQVNQVEQPNTKIQEEKASNVVPKKRRGLRKKRLINNDKKFNIIAFSGFQENEIPQEKDLMKLNLELVQSQFEKFDLLVVSTPFKRTFKFLVGLMYGAEIVTYDWLKDSFLEQEQLDHQDYIPESEEFEKQFGLSIKQIIQCRDDYFESNDNIIKIFEGKYYVNEDVIPSKAEIEYLITLGGGHIVRKSTMKNVYVISENKKPKTYGSDFILDACMFYQ